MLAGSAPCAEIAQLEIAKAIAESGAPQKLKGLAQEDFIPVINTLLPPIKAAVPDAKGDDIVNGLTTAFCQAGRNDPAYEKLAWHAVIGSFSSIVYSQMKNPEVRASKDGAMPTP